MPELPEVQTIVSELNRKLRNRSIKLVSVNAPKMISLGPHTVSNIRKVSPHNVGLFIKLLRNQKVLSVKRRAKLLIFNFSGPLSMLVHLKMTGQFIFEDKQQRAKTGGPFGSAQGRHESYRSVGKYRIINKLTAPKVSLPSSYTHVIFYFKDGSTLYYNDVRKFGYLKLVRDNELNQVKELQGFGPEPFDKKFTYQLFDNIVNKRPNGKIKQVLMDASFIAGIGNIYSDEILFHAKVRPMRTIKSLSDAEKKSVYSWIRLVLKKAIAAKGSSVGDFVRTDGSWGQMGKFHFVYGRAGENCKRCGTIIKSVKLNGRTGSFCPKCQK